MSHPITGLQGTHTTELPKPGRPPLNSTETALRITITLTAEDLALIEEIGQGNRSEGVRLAVRTWRAQMAEIKRILTHMEADPTSIVSHDELKRRLAEKRVALDHVDA